MPKAELKQLVGSFREHATGKIRRAGWNMDQLLLGGRQIATINRVPGSAIGLFPGVMLTPAEVQEVVKVVAAARGGVKPCKVSGPIELPFELLDDENDVETDLAESDLGEAGDE